MVTEIKVVLISFLFWWIKQLHWKSNNGKLLLYKDGKKPKCLYNKAQERVTKMTYVIVTNPREREEKLKGLVMNDDQLI